MGEHDERILSERRIKPLISELMESSSFAGISKINGSHRWYWKVFWTILFLLSSVMMIIQLKQLFDQYYSWPVKTNFKLGYSPLPFPSVTFCNTNPVRKSKLHLNKELQKTYQKWVHIKERPGIHAIQDHRATDIATELLENITSDVLDELESEIPFESYDFDDIDFEDLGNYTSMSSYDVGSDEYNMEDYFSYLDYMEYVVGRNDFNKEMIDVWHRFRQLFKFTFMHVQNHTIRHEMGHQLKDMLVKCTFSGQSCNDSDFETVHTNDFGNCYTFGKNGIVTRSTSNFGLSLTLKIERDEYLEDFTRGNGLRVAIHAPGTYPFPSEQSISVSACEETNIGLLQINISRKGKPYGVCDDGEAFFERHGVKYSVPACHSLCADEKAMQNCKCRIRKFSHSTPMAARERDLPECGEKRQDSGRSSLLCYQHTHEETLFKMRTSTNSDICTCHAPCKETMYYKTITSRIWPTLYYLKALIKQECTKKYIPNLCDTNATSEDRLEFAELNIFFEKLDYENIDEEPFYNPERFLSDIGGTIGLWLGVSILGLAEIVELLLLLAHVFYNKMKRAQHKAAPEAAPMARWENGKV